MSESRTAILSSIRRHLAGSAPFDALRDAHSLPAEAAPRLPPQQAGGDLIETFRQALEAVSGRFLLVADETAAAAEVRKILERADARRVAVSDAELARRVLGQPSGVEVLAHATKSDLFQCDAGVTTAQGAAAETGTLVLVADAERHRLASLVPPLHIALLPAARIRRDADEILQELRAAGPEALSRTVTFITGPSRTSDIELTLAIGVHGPAELYVIVIQEHE